MFLSCRRRGPEIATFVRVKRPSVVCACVCALSGVLLLASSAWADPIPVKIATPVTGPPTLAEGQHFTIDPVADGVLIAGGGGFAAMLGFVLGTGEIQPATPGPTSNLLSIDRIAVTQTLDPHATTFADATLYTAIGFAVLDPILSGVRDGWDAFVVDGVLYAESIAVTEALTDITKIAVRRPRPIDYIDCEPPKTCSATDFSLSFFSGHASTVATIGATATYLAFMRDPKSARPWITLGAAVAMTTFVSYERVRSGDHFPTDVITGALAGAVVGVLVPHLHRHKDEAPPVWIGAAPAPGGGTVSLGAVF
jgi:membrane-associated phospholipid phosphatase